MPKATPPVKPGPNQLLTTQQVYEEYGIPVATLKWWRQEKTGPPYVRTGRSIRYRRKMLDAWLADHEQDGAA